MNILWRVDIGRVVLRGVDGGAVDPAVLSAAVTRSVKSAMDRCALPPGRRANATVEVRTGRLAGSDSIARAVAGAVTAAVGGGADRG